MEGPRQYLQEGDGARRHCCRPAIASGYLPALPSAPQSTRGIPEPADTPPKRGLYLHIGKGATTSTRSTRPALDHCRPFLYDPMLVGSSTCPRTSRIGLQKTGHIGADRTAAKHRGRGRPSPASRPLQRPAAPPYRLPPTSEHHLHQRLVRMGPRTGSRSPCHHGQKQLSWARATTTARSPHRCCQATKPRAAYPGQDRKVPGQEAHAAMAAPCPRAQSCRCTQQQQATTSARILAVAHHVSIEQLDRDRLVGPS
jgi:hypothetical protein